ncbi:pentapeptide repeat-containing protein [Actinomadura graeca]|uniref:Pentapeptide repeat-containing protein n=1 Tax=Actinomadura graeca TaxID=2750812 RepID=A0ABX8QQ35_9ACTN|nr:pentapeptide repeat-containing protein [Actinomadura graeca]QXJ20900.1 pentapeptide repeat-containing protein [Actinomadura graeca]
MTGLVAGSAAAWSWASSPEYRWYAIPVGLGIGFTVWALVTWLNPLMREMRRARAAELAALPVKEREDLRVQRTQSLAQMLSSLGVLVGVAFTALSLVYTAQTLRATQEAQITDRYSRTVEQLGNRESREARTGAIYALGRLAHDSDRDRTAIANVLATYVHEHIRTDARRPAGGGRPVPSVDVRAALHVLGDLGEWWGVEEPLDLHGMELGETIPLLLKARAHLNGANLSGAGLREVDLKGEQLDKADLSGADLTTARLEGADLHEADLSGAVLSAAVLRNADLHGSDLRGANLSALVLWRSKHGFASTLTDLQGADLANADLRGAKGMPPADIRRAAKTVSGAKFE